MGSRPASNSLCDLQSLLNSECCLHCGQKWHAGVKWYGWGRGAVLPAIFSDPETLKALHSQLIKERTRAERDFRAKRKGLVKVKIQNRAEMCTHWKESETYGEQQREPQQAYTTQGPLCGVECRCSVIWIESNLSTEMLFIMRCIN
jgi:hypothetical protein